MLSLLRFAEDYIEDYISEVLLSYQRLISNNRCYKYVANILWFVWTISCSFVF